MSDEKLTVVCNDIEYWKNAYFDLVFKRGSYVSHLRTLNENLREELGLLRGLLDAVRRVGDTVYVDNTRIKKLMYRLEDQRTRNGLKRSRYYKDDK